VWQISLQYLVCFKNYKYLNFKVHFKREQVTKLRYRNSVDYHIWEAVLERCLKVWLKSTLPLLKCASF